MKISIWAAQNKQWGRMWPVGRQFDMPDLEVYLDFGMPESLQNSQ